MYFLFYKIPPAKFFFWSDQRVRLYVGRRDYFYAHECTNFTIFSKVHFYKYDVRKSRLQKFAEYSPIFTFKNEGIHSKFL